MCHRPSLTRAVPAGARGQLPLRRRLGVLLARALAQYGQLRHDLRRGHPHPYFPEGEEIQKKRNVVAVVLFVSCRTSASFHFLSCLQLVQAPAAILFMIIFNGVGAFNELSLANPFYQWGWAMPMAHAVMASRTLIYGGRDQLGIDVGAVAIWAVFMFFVAFFTIPKPKPAQ
mmetsp:Transcript_4751/g.14557  ORF Transcript_4751/g.14557 Transcript_4751/m.14557 type:complete len:172 (+) Transcript_4751:1093-1608(+)